jgi:hypothetical protein
VRAVWLVDWQKCDVCVNGNAKHDPHKHGIEDGMVDIPQQNKEAGEEKEDGKM